MYPVWKCAIGRKNQFIKMRFSSPWRRHEQKKGKRHEGSDPDKARLTKKTQTHLLKQRLEKKLNRSCA
jgi:hypothetical protein